VQLRWRFGRRATRVSEDADITHGQVRRGDMDMLVFDESRRHRLF